jgi:hypothetical protein
VAVDDVAPHRRRALDPVLKVTGGGSATVLPGNGCVPAEFDEMLHGITPALLPGHRPDTALRTEARSPCP